MITNYDDQVQLLELIRDTMSKIKDEIPHLESWSEAEGYLNWSTFVLRLISQMLPPKLDKDVVKHLDSEIKLSNEMIDRLRRGGILNER